MIQQLSSQEWTANGSEVPLCQLPFTVCEVEKMAGIQFTSQEPQRAPYSDATVQINGSVYLLEGARDVHRGAVHSFVSVTARGDVRDPSKLIEQVCLQFSLRPDELLWVSEDLRPRDWMLCRVDDDGNRVPMWYFKDHELATGTAKLYTKLGHKQLYYVESAA